MPVFDDEFRIGKGRRSREENHYPLNRRWQRPFSVDRFSPTYIANCYSRSPQAVYKIVSFGRGISAKKVMEYVNTREGEAQTFYTESGEQLRGQEDIDSLYKAWSGEFRKKGSGRGEQRHITHMLLSADVEPTYKNADKVLAAARDTLWESFGSKGFEYTYVLHTDTDHPHVHVVMKNYNRRTKRKLRLDRHDLLQIRTDFADSMKAFGLRQHIATLRRDRPEVLRQIRQSMERMSGQKERMDHLLDECAFLNRKTQLNAQITKKVGRIYDYDQTEMNIRFDGKRIQIKSNKVGKPFEYALQTAAKKTFSGNAALSAIVYDKELPTVEIIAKQLTPEQTKQLQAEFRQAIDLRRSTQEERIAQRTKDVLPAYRALLKQTDTAIKRIRNSNKLSVFDKHEQLKAVKALRHKLLNSYDLKAVYDASTLASGHTNEKVLKEVRDIQQKQSSAREFMNRKRALENWEQKYYKELDNRIYYYKGLGHQDTVSLLRDLRKNKTIDERLKTQRKVRRNIFDRSR